MNIIFLDIDGVLNSMAYFEQNKGKSHMEISDYHLQMLAQIYRSMDSKIVLSSSWRELDDPSDVHVYRMYQYLLDELARYNMEIISKTPVINMNRPLEIKTWLEENPQEKPFTFVILDDDFDYCHYAEYGLDKYLVRTSFYCDDISEGGLQPKHVKKAIKILNGEILIDNDS